MENIIKKIKQVLSRVKQELSKIKGSALPLSILAAAVIIAGTWVYTTDLKYKNQNPDSKIVVEVPQEKIIPAEGVVLPVKWGDLGKQMVTTGVIDASKFEALYANRGGLDEVKKLLDDSNNGNLKITPENSGMILNLLWALGLGTKNDILDKGPMTDAKYGGAGNFASTGGWTLSKGKTMDHYSHHKFITLSKEQQDLVERVSKGIFRPCCGNSTYFPDCNHGMAMLGLLELMASQGVSEKDMYQAALQVNSYWFPDTYMTIAKYLKTKGIDWEKAKPEEILGFDYSSGSGYSQILKQVSPPTNKSSGGCGI